MKKNDLEQGKNTVEKVIVLGRNYCNILTMVRALGKGGYKVDVLRLYKTKPKFLNLLANIKPDKYSKYTNSFKEFVVNDDYDKLTEELVKLKSENKRTLLIPVDDYSAYFVDSYLEELKDDFLLPNIKDTKGAISNLMEKNKQKNLAANFGLPVLQSQLIVVKNGGFDIPKDLIYPCFIKPNISVKGNKGIMKKCQCEEELKELLLKLSKKGDLEILVEPFVDIKNEYSLVGYSVSEDVAASGAFKCLVGGNKERKGVTMIGEIVDLNYFDGILSQCCQFIKSLNFTGFYDIDFIETSEGKIYFVELNFRAGASMYALVDDKVNPIAQFADCILNETKVSNQISQEKINKKFISEKILLEEFVRSDVDKSELKNNLKSSDIFFIKDEEDVEPYKHFKKYYKIGSLLRIPYKVRDFKNSN